jgi:lysozyme family protein
MGIRTAATFLQRALNVLNRQQTDSADLAVDGVVGQKVMRALSAFLEKRDKQGETVLLKALNSLQGARYIELAESRPANENFVYGWLKNRVT